MDINLRRELMDRYAEGPAVVEAAVGGLSDEELDRAHEGWTPRQVVHHLADSEMMSAIRLRRLLAEDAPRIDGYDETEFARRLHYGSLPIGPSLAAVRAARETSLALLERISEDDWLLTGTHSESGPYGVLDWLRIYAAHCHDHAAQVRRAGAPPTP